MFSGLSKVVKDFGTKSLESAYFKEIENKTFQKKLPKHILELKNDEKQEFQSSFDLVITDCDGVIWGVHTPIEGAGEAINLLKAAGKKIAYVSNNSIRSGEDYKEMFQNAGIEADLKDLLHPQSNIIVYLKEIKFTGLIYCIGTEKFKNSLIEAGFDVANEPNRIIEESYSDLAKYVFQPPTTESKESVVRAVVMDVDFNLSAAKLIRAQQFLKHPDCILVVGATDFLLPIRKDITFIGPGAYVKIVSDATGKEAKVLGKPGKELCEIVLEKYSIKDRNRVLMIGDMLEQDVGFGKVCGFQTLAVLTGGCKREDFEKSSNHHVIPDYYADSLSDFIKFFHSSNNKL